MEGSSDCRCCVEPLQEVLKRLPEEQRAQEGNVARVDALLARARPHWRCDRRGMLHAYLQQCILPRVVYSPADAAFCARFTQRLHELAIPFFPTILYLDTVRAPSPSLQRPRPACLHSMCLPALSLSECAGVFRCVQLAS